MAGHLLQAVADQLMPRPPEKIGVAVSGGGDSTALLCLIAEFAKSHPIEVHAISIDHGLREAARDEVRSVTELCARLRVSHHVEYWSGWDGGGNLQHQAREARYQLIADWGEANGIDHVALGHTANDQAETLIMRLARGSGVDGLSAMVPRRTQHGVTWLRPLLSVHRRALREYLQAQNISWVEDPSNEDYVFERVRVREVLRLLEPLGLTVDMLVQVAHNMSKAREALDWQTFVAAKDIAKVRAGAIAFDLRHFRTLPEEIARRMLVRGLAWISGNPYPPRRSSLDYAIAAIRDGRTVTVDGCQISRDEGVMWMYRELNAVKDLESEAQDIWDNRWILSGPEDDDDMLSIKPLGEDGLSQVENWKDLGVPREALLCSPAVWREDELVAAPVAGFAEDWVAELEGGNDAFFAALLTH